MEGKHDVPPPPFFSRFVSNQLVCSDYPNINIKIIPPFQLENLLPYDMQYVIIDKSDNSTRQEHTGVLAKGALDTIHTIFPTHLLALIIRLPETGTS